MRIIIEQQLPTDLSILRKFVDKATSLVDADMTAIVSHVDVIVSVIAGCGYRTCAHCKPVDENKLASWVFLGYLKALT